MEKARGLKVDGCTVREEELRRQAAKQLAVGNWQLAKQKTSDVMQIFSPQGRSSAFPKPRPHDALKFSHRKRSHFSP